MPILRCVKYILEAACTACPTTGRPWSHEQHRAFLPPDRDGNRFSIRIDRKWTRHALRRSPHHRATVTAVALPTMRPTSSIRPAITRTRPAAWSAAVITGPIHPTVIRTRPVADFGAAYHDGIANYNMPTSVSTSGGYYQTGQAGQSQTTYYRPVDPSSPSTNGPG